MLNTLNAVARGLQPVVTTGEFSNTLAAGVHRDPVTGFKEGIANVQDNIEKVIVNGVVRLKFPGEINIKFNSAGNQEGSGMSFYASHDSFEQCTNTRFLRPSTMLTMWDAGQHLNPDGTISNAHDGANAKFGIGGTHLLPALMGEETNSHCHHWNAEEGWGGVSLKIVKGNDVFKGFAQVYCDEGSSTPYLYKASAGVNLDDEIRAVLGNCHLAPNSGLPDYPAIHRALMDMFKRDVVDPAVNDAASARSCGPVRTLFVYTKCCQKVTSRKRDSQGHLRPGHLWETREGEDDIFNKKTGNGIAAQIVNDIPDVSYAYFLDRGQIHHEQPIRVSINGKSIYSAPDYDPEKPESAANCKGITGRTAQPWAEKIIKWLAAPDRFVPRYLEDGTEDMAHRDAEMEEIHKFPRFTKTLTLNNGTTETFHLRGVPASVKKQSLLSMMETARGSMEDTVPQPIGAYGAVGAVTFKQSHLLGVNALASLNGDVIEKRSAVGSNLIDMLSDANQHHKVTAKFFFDKLKYLECTLTDDHRSELATAANPEDRSNKLLRLLAVQNGIDTFNTSVFNYANLKSVFENEEKYGNGRHEMRHCLAGLLAGLVIVADDAATDPTKSEIGEQYGRDGKNYGKVKMAFIILMNMLYYGHAARNASDMWTRLSQARTGTLPDRPNTGGNAGDNVNGNQAERNRSAPRIIKRAVATMLIDANDYSDEIRDDWDAITQLPLVPTGEKYQKNYLTSEGIGTYALANMLEFLNKRDDYQCTTRDLRVRDIIKTVAGMRDAAEGEGRVPAEAGNANMADADNDE